MPDDPRKLSHEELARVLQRAAEREGREGPRTFTAADVVQAGRELGLAPGTVEAELEAMLSREQALARRERPFDTRVTVESSSDRFFLRVPPRGIHGAALAKVGFSVFWLGFIAFWTGGALTSGAPLVFPLFSIPFWLVGIGLVAGAIKSIFGSQKLDLQRESGTLSSSPGLQRKLHTRELRARLDRQRRRRQNPGDESETPVLILEHGTRSYRLLEGFSEAEQRWVKAELDHWLAR